MSICSDVYISKEEAVIRATKILMYQQEELVNKAVKHMDKWELSNILNSGSDDTRFYNIKETEE